MGLTDGVDAVVLAADASGVEDGSGSKISQVDEHVYAVVSGLRADGRVLIDRARQVGR